MKKNYNYNYENRQQAKNSAVEFSHIELASCTVKTLKKSPVVNGTVWHTTDTNEFYYDWNGKRNKLNVTGDNASMAAEIAKIKADVAKLNPEKISQLEDKVNTAASKATTASTKATQAAQTAQQAADAANEAAAQIADKVSQEELNNAVEGLASKQWVEDKGYLTQHQSLAGYATEQWVEGKGYLTSADIPEIPDLSEYATKQDLNNLDLFSGDYNDLENKPELFSGDYNDLSNKPEMFSGDYNDLSNKPELFSGSYNDLTDKPEMFSGDYNDLSNKPELFSGSYNDLTDKPTIPEIPENVSAFNNDAGYLTEQDISGKADKTDLNGLASQEWVSEQGYLTAQSISGKADITYVDNTFAPKDDIPVVPKNVSAFNNDAGYLTEVETGSFPADSDIEDESAPENGYAKVQDIMDYVNALIEKKKDELVPGGDSADYIYINGIQIADKLESPQTEPIYKMNCFEIDDDMLEHGIMVAVGPEINGYDGGEGNPATTYAQLFSIDVPDGYSIEVHGFDGIGKDWYSAVQPMSPNPRYATKNYGSKTYNCYVRTEEDFYGDVAKPADKYKIIINKN